MLKNPLGWYKRKVKPIWKLALQRVAVVLLVASLSVGGVMVVSPTARAAVIRWVVEWYEAHIIYRYSGEDIPEGMPQYEITALPEGYTENEEKRIQMPEYGRVLYENAEQQWIWLRYVYVQQGAASVIDIDGAEVKSVMVNGYDGYLILSENFEEQDNTVTWIDDEKAIQFTVDGHFDEQDILNIAESVEVKSSSNGGNE